MHSKGLCNSHVKEVWSWDGPLGCQQYLHILVFVLSSLVHSVHL